jgi:hypothetical protein
LCRVRRVSDNQEQDIGVIGGKVDFNALRDFAGVSMDARVVTVYDQTGGTNHLTQSIPGNQPVLQPQGPVRQLSSPQVLGGEVFSASSVHGSNPAEEAFDGQYGTASEGSGFWHSVFPIYDASGAYTGSVTTVVDGSSVAGEWLQIQFPQGILIDRFSISPRQDWELRVPDTCTLAGSNDGTIWTSIQRFTGVSGYQYQADTMFDVSPPEMYSHYRLIFEHLLSTDAYNGVQITQFKIWGVPLQDLDGSLRMMGGYLTPSSHPTNNSYVYQQGTTITELTQNTTQPVENPDLGAALLQTGAPVTGPYVLDGYRVEASSVRDSFYPWFAFNKDYGNQNAIWLSDDAPPVWLSITYPEPILCTRYSIRSRNLANYVRYPKAWTLQGLSIDGHWVILDERVETSWGANTRKDYIVSKSFPCSSYRLYITDVDIPSASPIPLAAISEWKLFTTPARPPLDTIYMLPGSVEENPNLGSAVLQSGAPLTGPYELDGYALNCSSYWGIDDSETTYRPAQAFNKTLINEYDAWYSGQNVNLPQWLSITYPTAVIIQRYSITSRDGYFTWVQPPHSWIVEGSNDGTVWDVIDTQDRVGSLLLPGWSTVEFNVSTSRMYTTYRITVTEALYRNTTTISTDNCGIAEWKLFTTPNPGLGKLLAKNTLATQSLPGQIRQRQQMPIQAVSYQDLMSLISVSRRDLVVNAGKTSIQDQSSGQEWNFGLSAALVLEDGVPCVDLTAGGLTLNGTGAMLGQEYTLVYYWKPLVGATTYRTLHRNNLDHLATVVPSVSSSKLGFWSSRDSVVVDTGYDAMIGVWQTLIVTSVGDSSTSSTGVGTFYVNDQNVGTVDHVGCGTQLKYIGASNDPDIDPANLRPPGHVAVAGVFNRTLSRKEITKVHRLLERWGQGQYTQQIPRSVGRSYSVRPIGVANGGNQVGVAGLYQYHIFTSNGTLDLVYAPELEVVVVGGGGAGGVRHGGGGGAGGLIQQILGILGRQQTNVIVGAGGVGGVTSPVTNDNSGENSEAFGLVAIGGGGSKVNSGNGLDGGSGGGSDNFTNTPGSGTHGQGNDGGFGSGSYPPGKSSYSGGGGGGAGTAGNNSVLNGSLAIAGHGGDGRTVFMTGSPMALAGGGGGGVASNGQSAGNGGLGGGGAGSKGTATASDGVPNTGGGGGGSGFDGSTNGANGSGGSGIVIVRYKKYVTPPRLQSIDFTDCILFLDAEESLSYSGSGGTWNDLMGRSHGTLGNSPSFLASSPKAFSFNGSNQYVDFQLSNPGGNWAHSVSVWFKHNDITYHPLFRIGVDATSRSSGFLLNGAGTNGHIFFNYGGAAGGNVYKNYTFNLNQWYHLVLTYNGTTLSTANKQVYINGVSQTLTGGSSAILDIPENAYLEVAKYSTGQPNFDGSVAQFGIWSRVLSPGEIQAMYDQFKGEY